MGKNRLIVTILVIVLVVASWASYLNENTDALLSYNKSIKQADAWVEEGLYDRAIDEYNKAMEYKPSKGNWEKILRAYKLRSEETDIYGRDAIDDYITELELALSALQNDKNIVVELVELYIQQQSYEKAYDALTTVKENGVKDDEIEALYRKVKYTYKTKESDIKQFTAYSNGEYSIYNGVFWGTADGEGQQLTEYQYTYVGIIGEDAVRIITKEQDSRIYQEDKKVLGKIPFAVTDAGVYSEELIAIKEGEIYNYYNSFGKKQFGGYSAAGTFKDGKAAVCNNGKWGLINNKGKESKDFKYDDIVLGMSGYYINNDVIIASENGKYGIYDEKFKKRSDFSCDQIGIPTADKIYAYREGDKWGFVNSSGEVVIEPQYEGAKSFSNGLAAVCVDGKWGFIDEENQLVISCEFGDADYFNESGACMVKITDSSSEDGYIWGTIILEVGLQEE